MLLSRQRCSALTNEHDRLSVQELRDQMLAGFAKHEPPKWILLQKLAEKVETASDSEAMLVVHRRYILAQRPIGHDNVRVLLEAFRRTRNWDTLLDTLAESQRHQLFFNEPNCALVLDILDDLKQDEKWEQLERLHSLLPGMGVSLSPELNSNIAAAIAKAALSADDSSPPVDEVQSESETDSGR